MNYPHLLEDNVYDLINGNDLLVEQDPIIESTDAGGLDKEPEPES